MVDATKIAQWVSESNTHFPGSRSTERQLSRNVNLRRFPDDRDKDSLCGKQYV